jgi:hypothetical protein
VLKPSSVVCLHGSLWGPSWQSQGSQNIYKAAKSFQSKYAMSKMEDESPFVTQLPGSWGVTSTAIVLSQECQKSVQIPGEGF